MEDQTTPAGDDQPQAAPAVASEGGDNAGEETPAAPAEGDTPAEGGEEAAA